MLVEHVHDGEEARSTQSAAQRIKGGIAEQESPIDISNVALVCPTCGPVRIGHKMEGDTQGARLQEVRADAAHEEVRQR